MEYWHKEERESLIKAMEAMECNNIDRWEMWMKRSKEARLRCNKDFRTPLDELTGRSNFSLPNDQREAQPPAKKL